MLSEEDENVDDIQEAREEILPARRPRAKSVTNDSPDEDESPDSDGNETVRDDDDPITVKDRQSLINVEHPFGLPIWKPALYKKSRSITRNADAALHSIPSAQAERHLSPGNIFWVMCFGWWLALTCFAVALVLCMLPLGGRRYATLVFGLGWYLGWPFGKYVEGDREDYGDEENQVADDSDGTSAAHDTSLSRTPTITPATVHRAPSPARIDERLQPVCENTSLLPIVDQCTMLSPSKSYGATPSPAPSLDGYQKVSDDWIGRAAFWITFSLIIAPLMLLTCIACWALIITIPMAKLIWALIQYIFANPTRLRFCAPPPAVVVTAPGPPEARPTGTASPSIEPPVEFSVKHPRLSQGQVAPSTTGTTNSTVLLCVYHAIGWRYFKYTVGGVNIIFVNLLPLVFFVIFDGFVLLPLVEHNEATGKHVPTVVALIASRAAIFIMSLASVIPLSYFIGMAVASISAQSSIGMGAVINATFGSIIEIILYCIALTQGKGHLVEGSIVGSLLAGVLLMPGISMCAGAFKKKEQRFNAKSAGVTSMMLIMAFIGTLTPTLFYQIYGNVSFEHAKAPDRLLTSILVPTGLHWLPSGRKRFVRLEVRPLFLSTPRSRRRSLLSIHGEEFDVLLCCCSTLCESSFGVVCLAHLSSPTQSYLVGLWFSLRTHASQIWQNPQPLLNPLVDISSSNRLATYLRSLQPTSHSSSREPRYKRSNNPCEYEVESRNQTPAPRPVEPLPGSSRPPLSPASPSQRRVSIAAPQQSMIQNYTPIIESVDLALKNSHLHPMQLPENMSTDDFTRAVAIATVSALRHQQAVQAQSPAKVKLGGHEVDCVATHGGHEAPEWSRTTSAAVLLGCTALYALIAGRYSRRCNFPTGLNLLVELLVDVVDVVLQGSGIEEKFLGVTLFALVPNTTEFMNAISFALNSNIALRYESR